MVGSGSNLLVADEGFRGLVIKLDGSLATIERDGDRLLCGGGARLPQAAAFAAREGLSGLEFGVNIPGTVGGAVKMNANAYGGDLARVLEWVEVTTPHGGERRSPGDLGFSYRRSNLEPREIVARASFALSPAEPGSVKATLAEMRAARRAAQPSGIKTFGSTFKNPEDPRAEGSSAGVLLDEAGCRGLTVGGARFSEKHANFVENMGDATTADVIALMGEGRRRVRERFGVELEPEVQFLGEVDSDAALGQRVRGAAAAIGRAQASAPGTVAAHAGAAPAPVARDRHAALPRAGGRLPLLAARLIARGSRGRQGQRAHDQGRRARARDAHERRAHHDHPERRPRAPRAGGRALPGRARARGQRGLPARPQDPRDRAPSGSAGPAGRGRGAGRERRHDPARNAGRGTPAGDRHRGRRPRRAPDELGRPARRARGGRRPGARCARASRRSPRARTTASSSSCTRAPS